MQFIVLLAFLCLWLCAGMSLANLFDGSGVEENLIHHTTATSKRTTRTIKSAWPIQCVYTSMINQDDTWFLYRPILDCCYRCRKPYLECSKKTHPWFCYREAFACSTKCIVNAYWQGKNKPRSTAQILQNYPLTSIQHSKDALVTSSSDHFGGDEQSSRARRPRLPCIGHLCYGREMCFRTQLCYEVDSRYLKNLPVKV